MRAPSITHPDSLISWGAEFVDKISKIVHIHPQKFVFYDE